MSKVTKEMINAAHDVTMQSGMMLGHELLTKIYLAMDAKRQWVGLTNEEIQTVWRNSEQMTVNDVCRAIEAKLKEKNNG